MTKARRQRPRYREVVDALLAEIADARHAVGGMLPTELALCRQFGVSRYTVREALRRLDEMGVVTRRQGSGTVVRARAPSVHYTQRLSSLGELLQYPADTRLHFVASATVSADKTLAALLRCAVRKRWHHISGVRRAEGGAPICWSDIYVAPRHAAVSTLIGAEPEPVYALLERLFGLRASKVEVELFSGRVVPGHAQHLEVQPGTPALVIVRRYFSEPGQCFEISISEHPSGRFTYSLTMEQEWGAGSGPWA